MILSADKFGFYKAGNLKTYSKLESIEWQARTGYFPEWNFNKELFDRQNWHLEPSVDLWELYKARSRQIREKYDYCVILYSGGSDSGNLLKAWTQAGCRVDEIACFINYDASRDRQDVVNAEPTNVVYPTIKTMLDSGMDFVFREIDMSQDTVDYVKEMNVDYFYSANHSFSPNNIAKSRWRRRIPEYQNLINQGKSVCFIWGSEKPQLGIDNQGWYFQFLDIFDNCVSPDVQRQSANGWNDELFYWTPDMPEIVIKQAHVVKRFCDTCHDRQFYQNKKSPYGYNKTLNMYVSMDAIKQIIYPFWDTNTFVFGKSKPIRKGMGYLAFSERDKWFFDSNLEEAAKYESHMWSFIEQLKNPYFNWFDTSNNSVIKASMQKHYFA
jgi:hypothetical protein